MYLLQDAGRVQGNADGDGADTAAGSRVRQRDGQLPETRNAAAGADRETDRQKRASPVGEHGAAHSQLGGHVRTGTSQEYAGGAQSEIDALGELSASSLNLIERINCTI